MNKVLVIGLDGGTYTVLQPLIEGGKLPTLAALLAGGAWAELASTIPPLTAPAWASFITGKNPGKHGVFQFGPIDRSLYEGGQRRLVNSSTLSGQVLWDLVGREGKRVGVINVPLTYPPHPVNGFMVTGMLTPRGSDHFTYPPYLASSLEGYKIDVSVGGTEYGVLGDLNTDDPEVLAGLMEQLNSLVDMRTEVALKLMKMYSPDFFMILFTETDRLQHIFWPYLHPDRPQVEGDNGRNFYEAVEHFYRHLDHKLAEIIETAGENTVKILMSDHGFGPATEKNVNFNVWLRERGLLAMRRNPRSLLNPRSWLKKTGLSRETLYSAMNFLFPSNVVRRLRRIWGKAVSTPIDWERSKAVFIPIFEFVGGIEIILKERADQQGGLDPGEYEGFRNSLIHQLQELRDPQTNRPIVRQVCKREDLYPGVHTGDAPDIIFIMAPEYRGDKGLLSKSIITVKSKGINLWSGTHRREGIVVLSGPNISPGRISFTPQIQDLTPTILYLLGIAIPEDMDGQVIEEAIEKSYLAGHEIEYARPSSPDKDALETETSGLSREEEEKVRKQLESLGYLS